MPIPRICRWGSVSNGEGEGKGSHFAPEERERDGSLLTHRLLDHPEDGPLDVRNGLRVDRRQLVDELVVLGEEGQVEVEAVLDGLFRPGGGHLCKGKEKAR